MNHPAINEYCRSDGPYPDQIKSGKESYLLGCSNETKNKHSESAKLKPSNKRIRSMEKELHRKEIVLDKTTALPTLGKEFDAFWAEKEEG